MITIFQILSEAQKNLYPLETARLDAELLLAKMLQKSRSDLLAYPDQSLTTIQNEQYQALIEQRATKIPMAYLLGEKEFWSLTLIVNTEVLVPRPETELLVEKILVDHQAQETLTVIDLGTGSGAIALALAHERPHWQIIASDISCAALAIAKENAKRLSKKMIFIESDWFDAFPSALKADVVVSNPPYLAADDIYLQNSEISHEPKMALVAEKNGLAHYQTIAKQACTFLKPSGRIYFEHGIDQADSVANILIQSGYSNLQYYRDLSGLLRVVCAGGS